MKRSLLVLFCVVFEATLSVLGTPTLAANKPDFKFKREPHILEDPHIVGGKEAQPHSHPHQVGLLLNPYNLDQGFCGGSLLSDTWVVTAAHCTAFGSITEVQIVAGAHRIKRQEYTTQLLAIKKVYPHPHYDEEKIKNDISLILLHSPVQLNEYIQPIRLPSQKQKQWWFWNQKVTMTGWGVISDRSFGLAPSLREVQTKTTPNFLCSLAYLFRNVFNSNICASGWYSKGTCNGDSGGPMTITESDGKRTLIGISSFGFGLGCEKYWPTVFTRTAYFLDWIHSITKIPQRI